MKSLLQWLFALWRALWLGGLRLLARPWRWLLGLLGQNRPAEHPSGRRATGANGDSTACKPRAPAAPRAAGPPAQRSQAAERPRADEGPLRFRPSATARAEGDADAGAAPDPAPALVPEPAAPRRGPVKAGQFIEGVFGSTAGQREYKLYVPGTRPDGKLPLVVMLHGCKQDPDDFAAGTQMNRLADRHGVMVLYPAQSRSANGFGCWNWFNRHDQERDIGEPSLIAGMIEEVVDKHPVDRRRIYAAGLSAGGAMTAILAHTYPELLAAAGVHSGLAYGAAQDMITALGVMKRGPGKRPPPARAKPSAKPAIARAAVPLIVFHGDHDKTVHPLNGEQVVAQALDSVRAVKPHDHGHPSVKSGRVSGGHAYTRTVHTDRAGHVQVEYWLVQGSGHAWSGGDALGSFTDPLGPDASAEMLRFFLERSRA